VALGTAAGAEPETEVSTAMASGETPGHDTPTGTDPDATYDEPGYQDKSLGQAVSQDEELAEKLLEETDGDVDEAARRFEDESAGAPTRDKQGHPETS
jgi:hypothetical protein